MPLKLCKMLLHKSIMKLKDNKNRVLRGEFMKLREEVNVERLLETFRDMALRDALLVGEHITQSDLLVQIAGVIVSEAMW